ncbi:Ger(x)C family spore germination protein [Metabacillus halosaccharovorans]|uniref:Ger(x)C family spore germination protein n=1 Tax=Metabacillus halosaccharovorans TaxID=930124 RepID=UPI000994B570|nr:Ger(x)C family spore germination protein [Metabacillus halosaccharovorans]
MKKYLYIILTSFVLVGCWDQHLMKDAILIRTITFDNTEDEKMELGVLLPTYNKSQNDSSQMNTQSIILSSVSNTPREGRMKLNREIPGRLDASKNKLILFGEEFAKGDIYPPLDVIWRDPRSSLSAKLAVVKGSARNILNIKVRAESDISLNILSLITSNEVTTIIPKQSIQTLASEILDPGEDFVLPLLSFSETEGTIDITGLALFNERKVTGDLSSEDTTLFLLLADKMGKEARFTLKVDDDEEYDMNNYITVNVEKSDRKLKVKVNQSGDITVDLNLGLRLIVEEYPKGNVPKDRNELNKKLSNVLSENANKIIKQLQEANCDGFGIGRQLFAFHNDVWKRKEQDKYFQEIKFITNVNAEIVQHGIVK